MNIIQVDYQNTEHAEALLKLLNAYALDEMGGGNELPQNTKDSLIAELAKRDFALSLLAYSDGKAVGLLNAFEAFSSFRAKGLYNIHDIYVEKTHRGSGIAQSLIDELKAIARKKGFCKLTLEVLSNNLRAQSAYRKSGFEPYVLKESAGAAQFWQLEL